MKWQRKERQGGAVALEFLFVFPLLLALLYAAVVYSNLFFNQVVLQNTAQEAAKYSLLLDRSQYTEAELRTAVETKSNEMLDQEIGQLNSVLSEAVQESATGCEVQTENGIEMLHCSISVVTDRDGLAPLLSFGWLGSFPPVPDTLDASVYIVF